MSIWRKLDSVNDLTTSLDNKTGMADGLAMRLGLMPGITRRILIGDGFATNLETTVGDGLEPGEIIAFSRTAVGLSVASTSALDTLAGGTGAQIVQVRYIDENDDEQLEIFTIFGTTPTPLTIPPIGLGSPNVPILAKSVNFMGVGLAGATEVNQGRIYIGASTDGFTGGKPDTDIWNVIQTLRGVANAIHMMVPQAISSHLVQITFSSDSTEKNDGLVVRERTRQVIAATGGGFVSRNVLNVHILGNITLNGIAFAGFNPGDVFQLTSQTEGNAAVSVSCSAAFMDVRNDVYPPTTEGPIIG